jgi:hypothetical protein
VVPRLGTRARDGSAAADGRAIDRVDTNVSKRKL